MQRRPRLTTHNKLRPYHTTLQWQHFWPPLWTYSCHVQLRVIFVGFYVKWLASLGYYCVYECVCVI